MSFFTNTTPTRVHSHHSQVDPYQLYELRRPHERSSNVVPQLPRQPDYAHTRLRYRRITSGSPLNAPTSVPLATNYPAAFRPARAYSFSSSDLSSFSLTSKSPDVQGKKTVTAVGFRKGGLRRCIQRVNRASPFRRTFRPTEEMDALHMNKHEAAPEMSSDFDISSDEDEDSFEDYQEQRRNSVVLPSSPLIEDDKLTRLNTAPIVIESLHKPVQTLPKSYPPSRQHRRALSRLPKTPASNPQQRHSTPHKFCFYAVPNSSSDRFQRAYSAHSDSHDHDRRTLKPSTRGNEVFSKLSHLSQFTPSTHVIPDHREAYIKHSQTFHTVDIDPDELSLSFVIHERKSKSSHKLLRKVLHAFDFVRLRAA
ncbi:hypothetical protein FGB62_190g011 [Gracilaria domingensis]|nr:hypothetical protein FGB62_190g011 [Gracilaria domingensis]